MKRFYICFVSAHQHNADDLFKALHSLPQWLRRGVSSLIVFI